MRFLTFLIIVAFSSPLLAQPSQQETEDLMKEINRKMQQIEQNLAKASIEPQAVASFLAQLKDLVKQNKIEQLPSSFKDFLNSNPDLLAKLKNPSASTEELKTSEDEIRRLLAQDENNLTKLLQQNPQILEKLFEEDGIVKKILEQHLQVEEDLQKLFNDTNQEMLQTEEQIKKLIELSQSMQQQMDQQSKQDQLKQESQKQEAQEKTENQNDQVQDPKQATQENNGNKSKDGAKAPNSYLDPRAWETNLPKADLEAARAASLKPGAKNYILEAQLYFMKLAKAAQLERQREALKEKK